MNGSNTVVSCQFCSYNKAPQDWFGKNETTKLTIAPNLKTKELRRIEVQ